MKAVHQLLAGFGPGDAISNEAVYLRDMMRSWGYESEIFAETVKKQDIDLCKPIRQYDPKCGAALIYHYSLAADRATELVLRNRGKRGLIYHNITPHHFFAPYRKLNAFIEHAYGLCKRGREALPSLRGVVDVCMADSGYNALELDELGFPPSTVLPVLFDMDSFRDVRPDPRMMHRLQGKVNLLFTGRLAPNKCQEDVVRAFAWYHRFINPESRLILVGRESCTEYLDDVRSVAYSLGVEDHVYIPGHVTHDELLACYRSSSLFLCMSEHEGFCVPLLEAYINRLPVLAFASTGVPWTMGDSGVLFHRKDFPVVAETAHLLVSDEALRRRVIEGQARRLADFEIPKVAAIFKNCVERLTS